MMNIIVGRVANLCTDKHNMFIVSLLLLHNAVKEFNGTQSHDGHKKPTQQARNC